MREENPVESFFLILSPLSQNHQNLFSSLQTVDTTLQKKIRRGKAIIYRNSGIIIERRIIDKAIRSLRRISGERFRVLIPVLFFILYICAYLLSARYEVSATRVRVAIVTCLYTQRASMGVGVGETGVVHTLDAEHVCVNIYMHTVYVKSYYSIYTYIYTQSASIARASSSGRLERRIKCILALFLQPSCR